MVGFKIEPFTDLSRRGGSQHAGAFPRTDPQLHSAVPARFEYIRTQPHRPLKCRSLLPYVRPPI
jgi:hypothetical protein